MDEDHWLLIIAIICAIPYGLVIAILIWYNRKNFGAWVFAIGSLLAWPWFFIGGALQLMLVIPLAVKFAFDGTDFDERLSRKVVYWVLGIVAVFWLLGSVIALLHDNDWQW